MPQEMKFCWRSFYRMETRTFPIGGKLQHRCRRPANRKALGAARVKLGADCPHLFLIRPILCLILNNLCLFYYSGVRTPLLRHPFH